MRIVVDAWVVPEAPLIVTVTGADCGPGDMAFVFEEAPPPQELNRNRAQITEPSASIFLARFLSIPPMNASPITEKLSMKGLNGLPSFESGRLSAAEAVFAETVRTEFAAPDPGVTSAGEKAHDRVAGRLEHESETALSKDPDLGATTILDLTTWPGVRLTDDGE